MKKIDFYFDFLSPYSFFAYNNPLFLEIKKKANIQYKPVLLAKLLNHFEIKGPGEVETKRNVMLKQCFRYAYKNNIKFIPPKVHPFNPLYAVRLATIECAGEVQEKVISALWKGAWQESITMDSPEELAHFLTKNELPGEELLEKSFSREVKKAVSLNIEEALSHKAFGVPSFIFNDELFWGNDSLEDLLLSLEGKDYYDKETYKKAITHE